MHLKQVQRYLSEKSILGSDALKVHLQEKENETRTLKIQLQSWKIEVILTYWRAIISCLFSAWVTGILPEKLSGEYGPLPKSLTRIMTKSCDFPYLIYDPSRTLVLFLRPNPLNQYPVSDQPCN